MYRPESFTMWVPGIELDLSGLQAGLFTHCPVLSAPSYLLDSLSRLGGILSLELSGSARLAVQKAKILRDLLSTPLGLGLQAAVSALHKGIEDTHWLLTEPSPQPLLPLETLLHATRDS